jgi:hypothetical protein
VHALLGRGALCHVRLSDPGDWDQPRGFSLKSPVMGGFTRWNVLGDPLLARTMPVFFSQPPEVVSGLLAYDAEAAWRAWNPVLWAS